MTALLTILFALIGGAFGCMVGVTYPEPQGRKTVTVALTIGFAALLAAITLGARS